jgi:WD40 repeat protein
VRVWSTESGAERAILRISKGGLTPIPATFSPDGKQILTSHGNLGGNWLAGVWDAGTGRELRTLKGTQTETAVFSPDGTRILTWSRGRPVSVWDARHGAEFRILPPQSAPADRRPGGRSDAEVMCERSGRVKLLDPQTWKTRAVLTGHSTLVQAWAFSPDGRRIVTGAQDGARVWDATTGRQVTVLSGAEWVTAVCFHPDGRHVVTGGAKGVRICDGASGATVLDLSNIRNPVDLVRYNDEGTLLVVATSSYPVEGITHILDPVSGIVLLTLTEREGGSRGFLNHVSAVAFSPDGGRIVTARGDTVKVWDAREGHELLSFRNPAHAPVAGFLPDDFLQEADPVGAVRFSPDGTRLIVVTRAGVTTEFDSAPLDPSTRPRDSAPPPRP